MVLSSSLTHSLTSWIGWERETQGAAAAAAAGWCVEKSARTCEGVVVVVVVDVEVVTQTRGTWLAAVRVGAYHTEPCAEHSLEVRDSGVVAAFRRCRDSQAATVSRQLLARPDYRWPTPARGL